ncbi:hypothetical protein [Burkholderia sp. WSM2230]|uniref:hypothetical protein n=1 Tax=Burkholderia sp. WSM2230 TaxID=944435 RepID=UPI00046FC2D2|nr:hypothetical protein [Burkholderia sp. WSM2230]
MSNLDRLRDLLLGYDDSPSQSTEDEMNVYFYLWSQRWRPTMFVDLARSIVALREPRNELERQTARIAAACIERAANSSREEGGRPGPA